MTETIRQDCHVHLNVADCINCKHEFFIAHEPGQLWYKCPSCHTEKATLRYEYMKPDPTLECTCGNKLFRITQKGVYCPNCGKDIQ